ncbi:hypothetical protein WJX72_008170 [[Myrmecia] bisecta]|uniref:C2 domain-containing protein n=1 Tax=[Myrmecia] bisecta TaxID=41462 RepID=A0AAW1Q4E8_9CHLO
MKKKGLLKDQLELVKVGGNGKSRYTIKPLEGQLAFDKGFYVFIRAVQSLTAHNKGVVVIGLAGPSGSGKTVFSEKVHAFIPGCTILSLDNYNDASRIIDSNFDDPRLTDYDLLLQNIKDLKDGKSAETPIYDFKQSKRIGYQTLQVPQSRVVIIEGIYALSARIRPYLDLRVSITGGVHFDLVKRVLRDINRSGQAPEEIIQQISDTVYPMYKAFIEPDLKTAHLRIYNTFNPFSGFMNATYILKSAKRVGKDAIVSALQKEYTTKNESETYDIYLLPPNEDPETCQSWLRMRNRDGRYNLMFEEWVIDGSFIISPRITFEVSVRILGGLMALGYEIGTIMKRTSTVYSDERLTIKIDDIEGMNCKFVQIQGKDRELVAAAGKKLGLDGTYIARSYIEQVQLEKLTASFQNVTDDLKKRFIVEGESLLDESVIGSSPRVGSFKRTTGFAVPQRPTMASSAPVQVGRSSRSSSGSNNGLLSQHIRTSHDGGGGTANGVGSHGEFEAFPVADFENRDPIQQAKVERLVGRLSERVEELAGRPPNAQPLDSQIEVLTTQQQALSQQLQQLMQDARKYQMALQVQTAGHAAADVIMADETAANTLRPDMTLLRSSAKCAAVLHCQLFAVPTLDTPPRPLTPGGKEQDDLMGSASIDLKGDLTARLIRGECIPVTLSLDSDQEAGFDRRPGNPLQQAKQEIMLDLMLLDAEPASNSFARASAPSALPFTATSGLYGGMSPAEESSPAKDPAMCQLMCLVSRAEGLPKLTGDGGQKAAPSVFVAAKMQKDAVARRPAQAITRIVEQSCNPVWNQVLTVQFEEAAASHEALLLALVNDESSKILARCSIPVKSLRPDCHYNLKLQLGPEGASSSPSLFVTLCLTKSPEAALRTWQQLQVGNAFRLDVRLAGAAAPLLAGDGFSDVGLAAVWRLEPDAKAAEQLCSTTTADSMHKPVRSTDEALISAAISGIDRASQGNSPGIVMSQALPIGSAGAAESGQDDLLWPASHMVSLGMAGQVSQVAALVLELHRAAAAAWGNAFSGSKTSAQNQTMTALLVDDLVTKQTALERLQRSLSHADSSAELAVWRIHDLTSRNKALAADVQQMRKLVHEERQSHKGVPNLAGLEALSREEMIDKAVAAVQAYGREKRRNTELVHRLQQMHMQILEGQECQQRFVQLQEAHTSQAKLLAEIDGSTHQIPQLRQAAKAQEKVIAQLEKLLKSAVAERKAISHTAEDRRTQIEMLEASVADLEQQVARVTAENTHIKGLNNYEEVERIQNATKTEIEAVRRQAADEVASVREQTTSELETLRAQCRYDLESAHAAKGEEIESIRRQKNAEIEGLREQKNEELEALRNQRLADLDALRGQLMNDLEQLRAQKAAELEGVKAQLMGELEALRSSRDLEANMLRSELGGQLDAVRSELEALQMRLDAAKSSEEYARKIADDFDSERLAATLKAEKAEASAIAAQNELLEVTKRYAREIAHLKTRLAEKDAQLMGGFGSASNDTDEEDDDDDEDEYTDGEEDETEEEPTPRPVQKAAPPIANAAKKPMQPAAIAAKKPAAQPVFSEDEDDEDDDDDDDAEEEDESLLGAYNSLAVPSISGYCLLALCLLCLSSPGGT